ncbi:MAG: SDR family NAD(P)-dependent oxidoreductase [Candidatus Hodarchaeales archaeon]|jgi:NAD(P)-dependent dehydrogenase (short-subunit alcohol dehydrogenase family)
MMNLANKTTLITGGALGYKDGGPSIGSAIAFKFATKGSNIVVVDILEKMGQLTVDRIKQSGGKALFVKADVSKTADVKKAIEITEEEFGQLNCLVNCAASYEGKIFNNVVETPEKDWFHIFDVNFHGFFRFAKYAIPLILKSGGGTIINISSGAAFKVVPNFAVYPCTKAAINALTRTLAVDFAPHIRSNAICPGFVRIANSEGDRSSEDIERWIDNIAKKYPLQRVCNVDEIANVALFLASDDSSYINGECITVDGGYFISDSHE